MEEKQWEKKKGKIMFVGGKKYDGKLCLYIYIYIYTVFRLSGRTDNRKSVYIYIYQKIMRFFFFYLKLVFLLFLPYN